MLEKNQLPQWWVIEKALDVEVIDFSPATLHGTMTGYIVASPDWSAPAWIKRITGHEALGETLRDLYYLSAFQLEEVSFSYEILLPDDDQPAADRGKALSQWCEGFLSGLGLGGISTLEHENEDIEEAFNDIIEIAQLNYKELEGEEDEEIDLMELEEYMRTVVMFIYLEFHQKSSGESEITH